MDTFIRVIPAGDEAPGATLPLDYEGRTKARQRVVLDSGEAAALMLKRGEVLRGGNWIATASGRSVLVRAAPEAVSTVRCDSAEGLARVAYHLGNRHVALQIGPDFVRYSSDHVLDDMVRQLGFDPIGSELSFEPEAGAYASHSHA